MPVLLCVCVPVLPVWHWLCQTASAHTGTASGTGSARLSLSDTLACAVCHEHHRLGEAASSASVQWPRDDHVTVLSLSLAEPESQPGR